MHLKTELAKGVLTKTEILRAIRNEKEIVEELTRLHPSLGVFADEVLKESDDVKGYRILEQKLFAATDAIGVVRNRA